MGLGLGVPLESEDPRLVEAITEIRNACLRNGVAPGIHTSGRPGSISASRKASSSVPWPASCATCSPDSRGPGGLNWTRAEMAEIGDGVAGAAVRGTDSPNRRH